MDDRLNSIADTAVTDLRFLSRSLAQYREPNHGRSVVEILITVVPFFGLWSLMWLALHIGYGLYLLLAIPTAGFTPTRQQQIFADRQRVDVAHTPSIEIARECVVGRHGCVARNHRVSA